VKIGEGSERAEECKVAWDKFVRAVAEAGGMLGDEQSFYGPSLNLEERRWAGALGWESSEVCLNRLKYLLIDKDNLADSTSQMRKKVLSGTAVKEAKKDLDSMVWNTFLAAFSK
jgi:hypothetical protein